MSEKKSNANHASASGNSSPQSETTNNSQAKPSFSSTTRLTSFLAPRDLTLGGNSVKLEKPKKIYTPNLNAQRKKKEDEPVVVQKNSKGLKNKHKGKGSDRGNKHQKSNLIQSSGIFTEGLADGTKPKSRYSGYRESCDNSEPKETLQRPKLNAGRYVNKEEEDQKLKLLLRDDFIEEDNDLDYQHCPVVLPILKEAKLFKEERDIKIETEEQIKIEEEENSKPAVIKKEKKERFDRETFLTDELDKKYAINVSQSMENKSNGYFLIRFPDSLPAASNENEDDEARPGRNVEVKAENKSKTGEIVFDNFKEGLLGKLQILKSGAARLCLGNHNFTVEVGPPVFFREDVIVAKVDNENKTGELVNLGSVHTNLICTPDWEGML